LENGEFAALRNQQRETIANTPIREARNEYLAFLTTEDRLRKTTVSYRGILECFADFAGGKQLRNIADIDLRLIDNYRASRRPHASDKTMHNEGSLIKSFLTWCCERELIGKNPLSHRKLSPPTYSPRGGPGTCANQRGS
jgi:site-specific recombinase XerD